MKKELKIFIKNLNGAKKVLQKEASYMNKHKFSKEEEYLRTKIDVIKEILYVLEDLIGGTKKGNDILFEF